jgi:hypothetical protein
MYVGCFDLDKMRNTKEAVAWKVLETQKKLEREITLVASIQSHLVTEP